MPAPIGPNRTPVRREIPNLWPKPKPKKEWSPLRRLLTVMLGLATLIGVPGAVIAFWPRMTVTPSGLFDESNAYSEIFTVANTGFLAFEDVLVGLGLCSVETENNTFIIVGDVCPNGDPHIIFGAAGWWTPELRRDEPFSVVLTDSLNIATYKYRAEHPKEVIGTKMMPRLKAANGIFTVRFRPWPIPWGHI